MAISERALVKEDIMHVAQLLHTMQEIVSKIEEYNLKKDAVKLNSAKRELLELVKRVEEVL